MTKASDNAYPSVLITEGTEPSAPAAGKQRLYIDSTTHHLKRTDSSGTDVDIETAAVGVTWTAGTAMPGSPATNQRINRTDLGMDFYYDGTRWVSTELFRAQGNLLAISAVFTEGHRYFAASKSLDVWVVAWDIAVGIFGSNDGSNFWTLNLGKRATNDTDTSVATTTTAAITASTWTLVTTAIGAAVVSATFPSFLIQASVKTGTPGNCLVIGGFTYRLIGT